MDINQKAVRILHIIFSNDGTVHIPIVLGELNISRRVLFYHLNKLNDFLHSEHLPIVETNHQDLSIDMTYQSHILERITSRSNQSYLLSSEERIQYIIISIALCPKSLTIEDFSRGLEVSRNTIVTDISGLKSNIANFGLTLSAASKKGYTILGEELTIRYYIMECLYSFMAVPTTEALAKNIIDHSLQPVLKEQSPLLLQQIIQTNLSHIESLLQINFTSDALNELYFHLVIMLIRSYHDCFINTSVEVEHTAEFQAAKHILERISKSVVPLSDKTAINNQYYLTTVLLSSKICDINEFLNHKNVDLYKFTLDLITTYEATACVSFIDRAELINHLLLHIRPMYNRIKYHIKIKNMLTTEIQKKYANIYNLTYLSIRSIEPDYGFVVPEDEIAYICVYLASWLEQSKKVSTNHSHVENVLIAGSLGNSAAALLREQLLTVLGNHIYFETIDSRHFSIDDELKYDLIVTTTPLDYSSNKIIQVSPLLTDNQKNRLLEWKIAQLDKKVKHQKISVLLDIVKESATIHDEQKLSNDFINYITDGILPKKLSQKGLLDILTSDHISILTTPPKLVSVIHESCLLFITEGLINYSYVQSVLDIIENIGPYGEISEGILMVHANKDEYAKDVGIHITLMKEPLNLEKWNKKIHILLTLVTPDNISHSNILKDIVTLLKQPDVKDRLFSCDFQSPEEAFHFISSNL